ncbi:redoxin domain-containing protein [Paenibacillus senegalensis]|uniref:redoxin domain-containing protein n=1 Tax=Paenibacillus senegalensis TaxID=1465766 RepID=UPI00028A3795|nr:redoxin domain-containing protein [Paenibacillus senegalensis]
MKKSRKWMQVIILGAVLILGGWTIINGLTQDSAQAKPGNEAPEFELVGLDGEIHNLSNYRGKAVVVNFWGTFCEPCREEMPDIQSQYEKWSDDEVVFLGLNLGESRVTAQNFVNQMKLTFPILLDNQRMVARNYGITHYPSTVFIRPDGKIDHIRVGLMDEQYIEDSVKKLVGS